MGGGGGATIDNVLEADGFNVKYSNIECVFNLLRLYFRIYIIEKQNDFQRARLRIGFCLKRFTVLFGINRELLARPVPSKLTV